MDRYSKTTVRYTLGHNSKKFECPQCGKKDRYRRYYDTLTDKWMPNIFGRCDRVNGCGYDNNLYNDLESLRKWESENGADIEDYKPEVQVQHIDLTPTFFTCAERKRDTNLFNFFVDRFGYEIAEKTFNVYGVTSAKDKSDMFWLFDENNMAITAKCIYYTPGTHHRDREKKPYWVHDALKKTGTLPKDYKPVIQPFGMNIMNFDSIDTVSFVESEKTALAMYAFKLSKGVCNEAFLATGGSSNTKTISIAMQKSAKMTKKFKWKSIYPDDDEAGKKWIGIAKQLKLPIIEWYNNLDENLRNKGLDIGDLILGYEGWK